MGRPLERDLWAAAIWDALWKVHPDGLTPANVRTNTGLTHHQVLTGMRFMRETFIEDQDVPVIYLRSENKWFIAPSWGEHTRQALRSEYLQQSAERLHSAEKILTKAQRAFPSKARRIRKIMRNTAYLREETEDLVHELSS